MEKYLKETDLLDFNHPDIRSLIQKRKWQSLFEYGKIGSIYHFVQNEISFGYNKFDGIAASSVLNDGYGQCNTKGTLLMALLRGVGIPCRIHGFSIGKKIQKGVITGIPFLLAPNNLIHSWVEVFYRKRWINLEGVILDEKYLYQLQCKFPHINGSFCGYAVAVSDFKNPQISWQGSDTYIQKNEISGDFGVFDDPDSLYERHGSNLRGLKAMIYQLVVRKKMNAKVERIRGSKKNEEAL